MAAPEKEPEKTNIAKLAAEELTRRALAKAAEAVAAEGPRLPEQPDQDPPVVTTREQAVAVITASARTCRGRLGSLQAPADAAAEHRDTAEYELRVRIGELLKAGDEDTAKALDTDTRQPCGYDFNQIILANPFDGLDHDYACPKCGLTGSYRAPVFPELVG